MNIRTKIQKWRSIRRVENELYSLSTRELDDLGISRNQIPHIARQNAR
ncbi:MAG: DUF1127 domain-containing protein [Pseudomonadota bacterium]